MKKAVKVVSILWLVAMILAVSSTFVQAAGNNVTGPEEVLNSMKNPNYSDSGEITGLGQRIVGIIQIVGVVIAVVVVLVIGIKYLIGSAEEKAEYKKTMIPYLVGAVLVFAGATIVNVVYNMVIGLNS